MTNAYITLLLPFMTYYLDNTILAYTKQSLYANIWFEIKGEI